MILSAPLQGYTEAFWRNAHAAVFPGSVDEYYLPFLKLEKGAFRDRDLRDSDFESNRNIPAVPQILVRNPDEAETLISMLEESGFRRVDFNFGCPFPKLTGRGFGAGMLANPDALRAVLRTVERHPAVQFSVKMRSGFDVPCLELAELLNDFPLKWIVLHPRTGRQGYRGEPDRSFYFRFRERSRNPVVYNGDVSSPEDSPDSVMLGRGLLADPSLAARIRGHDVPPDAFRRFHDRIFETLVKTDSPLPKLKTLWDYFLPSAEKRLRKKIEKSVTVNEYREYTDLLFEK